MARSYVLLAVLVAVLSYQLYTNVELQSIVEKFLNADFSFFSAKQKKDADRLFEDEELAKYDNLDDGLYLAIIGKIFDVTAGEKHYGPGQTYHPFTGRDASLAFVTGEFAKELLSDDVSSLTNSQLKSLNNWIKFYDENYIYKGKLIGRYWDRYGKPTAEYEKFEAKVKLAEEEQSKEEERSKMFPPCNVEWKADVGSRVWCTKQSGGVSRDWVGVPRLYFERPTAGQYRCACVDLNSKIYRENEGKIREYDGCPQESDSCTIPTN